MASRVSTSTTTTELNPFTHGDTATKARGGEADLGEALDAFAADTPLRAALGEEFCQAYEHLRRRQWQRERGDISEAERRSSLDC
jgi:glutamine synthetase